MYPTAPPDPLAPNIPPPSYPSSQAQYPNNSGYFPGGINNQQSGSFAMPPNYNNTATTMGFPNNPAIPSQAYGGGMQPPPNYPSQAYPLPPPYPQAQAFMSPQGSMSASYPSGIYNPAASHIHPPPPYPGYHPGTNPSIMPFPQGTSFPQQPPPNMYHPGGGPYGFQ